MSISFECPQCGKAFSVGDEFAGKKAKCKQCGGTMIVPAAAAAPVSAKAVPPPDLYGFDEPATLPPRAGAPKPETVSSKSSGFRKGNEASSGESKKRFAGFGSVLFVIFIALRIYGRAARDRPVQPPAQVPQGFASALASTTPWVMPPLPDRGPMREFQPGVMFQEVRIGPGHPAPGMPPAHGMTLYFYLPPGEHEPGSLPCVLVAPAGSIVITGMDLGEGDQKEHVPYVRAGFAVLSYSLDGHVPDLKAATDGQIKHASEAFLAAKSGLTNAKVALEWLLAKAPEVDKDRIYTAGHSSAGTMALLLAENEPRIKKAAAFAPRSDVEGNFPGPQKQALRQALPGVNEFFTTYNPKQHPDKVDCPLFLFHARDDSVVPVAETETFASTLKGLGKDVTVEIVPSGGHYNPMIGQGIPMAIAWFNGQDPSSVSVSTSAPTPRRQPRSTFAPGGPIRRGPGMIPQPGRPGGRLRPMRPGAR
jgi:dienelactone hydrolase